MGEMKLPRKKFISMHIPRTGGTTFKNVLFILYGMCNVYHDITFKGHGAAIQQPDANYDDVPSNLYIEHTDIIHGHFVYDKYKHLEWPIITWVRDPAKQVLSIFNVLSNKRTSKYLQDVRRMIRFGIIDLREFAKLDIVRNIQSRFFCEASVEDFGFVGVTECYKASVKAFGKWANIAPPRHFDRYNAKSYSMVQYSESDLNFIRSLNEKDMNIYETAIRRYK